MRFVEIAHKSPRPHRRSLRLKGFDYAQAGAYFVTMSARNRQCLFGNILDGQVALTRFGEVVREEWVRTATLRSSVTLDTFVVMPNHFHGIIVVTTDDEAIRGRGTARRAPTTERYGQPISGSIPTIIRSFKSAVTKRINGMRKTPGSRVWQRNYYEHVLRNERELDRVREYIANNPLRWELDRENPAATGIENRRPWEI